MSSARSLKDGSEHWFDGVPAIWQYRRKGDVVWVTPSPDENPSNPAYRQRWSSEYEFRPKPRTQRHE